MNVNNIFKEFEADENLTVESALFGENVDIVASLANENDHEAAVLTLESAGVKVGLVAAAADVLDEISYKVNEVKSVVDAGGDVTVESAQEVVKFISDSLGTIGMVPSQLGFEDEQVTVESATSFPVATINALHAVIADENLTVEAATPGEQTKWQKFKAWIKKVIDGAIAAFTKVWQFLSKAFVSNETTIKRLMGALDSYSDEIQKDKKLDRSAFHSSFPYLADYSAVSFTKAVTDRLIPASKTLAAIVDKASYLAEEQGKTKPALKQIVDMLPANSSVSSGKGIVIKFVGEDQKFLAQSGSATEIMIASTEKDTAKTAAAGDVKVSSIPEIKKMLNVLLDLNNQYKNVLPSYQKGIKSIAGKSPKDNSGFGAISVILSAVNILSANSGKTISSLVKVAAKHASLHVKK